MPAVYITIPNVKGLNNDKLHEDGHRGKKGEAVTSVLFRYSSHWRIKAEGVLEVFFPDNQLFSGMMVL